MFHALRASGFPRHIVFMSQIRFYFTSRKGTESTLWNSHLAIHQLNMPQKTEDLRHSFNKKRPIGEISTENTDMIWYVLYIDVDSTYRHCILYEFIPPVNNSSFRYCTPSSAHYSSPQLPGNSVWYHGVRSSGSSTFNLNWKMGSVWAISMRTVNMFL